MQCKIFVLTINLCCVMLDLKSVCTVVKGSCHNTFRIESLEAALQEKEKQLSEERGKFQKLKEDFKYNLRLLGERDQELDRYDTTFAGKVLCCIYPKYLNTCNLYKQILVDQMRVNFALYVYKTDKTTRFVQI